MQDGAETLINVMTQEIDHKALFDATPFPRFLMKPAGAGIYILTRSNQKALEWFHKDESAVAGRALNEILDGEAAADFIRAMDEAVRNKKPVTFKVAHAIPGIALPGGGFLVNPVPGPDGAIELLDIMGLPGKGDTDSMQRERDDAISLLTSVFDVSEVGIVVTDRHQRVVRVNDSFVRIYGWKRDELIGREFLNLITPDERDMARHNHEEFMESGIRSSGEMKIIRKDGNIANALFTTAALELSHGRRFQVTTIMDITLRKQMEMTLRLAKEQADAANQAKSTFLANMSHELRTPLNAIIGFSEMMMKETFGPLANGRYKEYMGDIHQSARHLLDIINEVLDMSKIEAGKVELDEEYFDVTHVIAAVTRMMDSRAFSSGLKIREHVPEDLPPLYADPRLVRQILINLVGNAVKYSNSGGIIDISAKVTTRGALHLIIADQGVGIPHDRIQDALEPFGRVSKPQESGGVQGTGLGLPLARAMAELHGGNLAIESDIGKGTTVVVEFPTYRLGQKSGGDNESPLAALRRNKVRAALVPKVAQGRDKG